jgi:hypothetical protein
VVHGIEIAGLALWDSAGTTPIVRSVAPAVNRGNTSPGDFSPGSRLIAGFGTGNRFVARFGQKTSRLQVETSRLQIEISRLQVAGFQAGSLERPVKGQFALFWQEKWACAEHADSAGTAGAQGTRWAAGTLFNKRSGQNVPAGA